MTPYLLREEIQELRDKWSESDPNLYGELSDLLLKAGKIPAAMNLMERSLNRDAIEIHSGGNESSSFPAGLWWFSRGLEYADACLYEEAHACLTKSLDLGHESFEGYYCLAGIEKSLGRLEEAELHCLKSLEFNPGFTPALFLFGAIAKMDGRLDESVEALEKAKLLNPDCATTHYDLACYYALTGSLENALITLETALEKGFCDFEWLIRDPDLMAVRLLPEFALLLQTYIPKKG